MWFRFKKRGYKLASFFFELFALWTQFFYINFVNQTCLETSWAKKFYLTQKK